MTSIDNCPHLHSAFAPECDLEFKLNTRYVGTSNPTSGPVVAGTVVNSLTLCKDTVVFKNLECTKNLRSIILSLPLKFVEDCHLFNLVIPTIPGNTDNNIIVKEINTQNQLALNFQVANGCLYVEIVIVDANGNSLIVFDGDGVASLELCFEKFEFDLTKKFKPCNCDIKCKPVTWICGQSTPVITTIP